MNNLIDALRRFGSATGQQALDALRDATLELLAESDHPAERELAAVHLGDIGDEQAIAGLLAAQEDVNSDVRHAAAHAIIRIGGPSAASAVGTLLTSDAPDIRRMALFALVMDGPGIPVTPTEIMPFLDDYDPSVRQQAIQALRNTSDPDAVPHLLTHLSDPDSRVALEAARALSVIHTPDALAPLNTIARDETAYYLLRGAAIQAIGRIGTDEIVSMLFQRLAEQDVYIRQQVILALPTIHTEDQAERLLQAAEFHRSLVRPTKDAMIRAGGPAVEAVMIRHLDHLRKWVRSLAVEVLGELGSTQAVPKLLNVLSNDEPEIRVLAANALGQVGAVDAVERLASTLTDGDSWLLEMAAASALRRIDTDAARDALAAWQSAREGD